MNQPEPFMRVFNREKAIERNVRIGARLHCARAHVRPNRAQFAREVGVDVSTIRKIEEGKRGVSRELMEHLAHALRISLDYLEWGSLNGVDPELAAFLEEHCQAELLGRPRKSLTTEAVRTPTTPMGISNRQGH